MVEAKQAQTPARAERGASLRSVPTAVVAGRRPRPRGRKDSLTGLHDRHAFCGIVERMVAARRPFGLFLIDLDDFRDINDTLGPDAGDALLVEVARRLRALGRPLRSVARISGDEFALIIKPARSFDDLAAAAARVLSEISFTFLYCGSSFECQATIGASLYPDQGRSRTELIKKADIALRQVKLGGKGRAELFDDIMLRPVEVRAAMLARARRALSENQLEVHYQPKLCLRSGNLIGFEALLRVCGASGPVDPECISAAFDHRRLAVQIGRKVRDRVIADIGEWIDSGQRFGHVAINVTDAEVRDPSWAPLLLHALSKAELPPWTVQVEITETVLLSRSAAAVRQSLGLLHACGVKIALDDFGTGFASLAHLRDFPVDTIKIDKSFIAALDEPDSAALVQAIIGLGKNLGMEVVAEGVETRAQHERLRSWGCDQAQGFLYGPATRQPFGCPINTKLPVQVGGQRRKKNCSSRSCT